MPFIPEAQISHYPSFFLSPVLPGEHLWQQIYLGLVPKGKKNRNSLCASHPEGYFISLPKTKSYAATTNSTSWGISQRGTRRRVLKPLVFKNKTLSLPWRLSSSALWTCFGNKNCPVILTYRPRAVWQQEYSMWLSSNSTAASVVAF